MDGELVACTCGEVLRAESYPGEKFVECRKCWGLVVLRHRLPIDEQTQAHPSVKRVIEQGYAIRYKLRTDRRTFLHLNTRRNGELVGQVCFEVRVKQILAERVTVLEVHRRKGIATAMYVSAEHITGLVAVRAADPTEFGFKLWEQPNRPFGNPTAPWLRVSGCPIGSKTRLITRPKIARVKASESVSGPPRGL